MLGLSKAQPGHGGLALGQFDVREPGPGEMLLKVHAAGVCGTDMSIYHDAGSIAKRVKHPTILGHEMCGTVVAVGPQVTRVKPGDSVSLESHIPCWTCKSCRTGRSHVCPNTRYPGIDLHGTFAEFITVPADIAWVNPPGTDMELAAMLEPLGIAVHATLEGDGVAGRDVVVNGCGPIGLMNVAVARHFGARRVIAVDLTAKRLQTAEKMGADVVINASQQDPVARVRDITGGEGADVVFEYTGAAAGVRNCFGMVAQLGEVIWLGTPNHPMEFDFGLWRRPRPTIRNVHGRRIWSTWEIAAPLVYENRIDLRPVASHRIPLADSARAFELIEAGEAVKPLIMCA